MSDGHLAFWGLRLYIVYLDHALYKYHLLLQKSWGQVILPQLQKPLGRLLKYQNTLRGMYCFLIQSRKDNARFTTDFQICHMFGLLGVLLWVIVSAVISSDTHF